MAGTKSSSLTPPLRGLASWLFGAFLLAAIDHAEGQTPMSNAICNSTSWTWSFNSKGQSPCLVAAYLLAPCSGGQWLLPALGPSQVYTTPNQTQANKCQCSTVTYSVLSACSMCQTGVAASWSSWRVNCANSMTSISTYPNQINSTTPVPAWAYLDVVTTDTFDPARAKQAANLPESTVGTIVSTISSTSTVPSGTSTLAPATSNKQSSNTLAVIGGSVGGVLGLGLAILLILYFLKRGSNNRLRNRLTPDLLSSPITIWSARHFHHPQNGHSLHP